MPRVARLEHAERDRSWRARARRATQPLRNRGPEAGGRAGEDAVITGSCLCGGIRFEITGKLGPMGACHCSMCRKATGSAFSVNALVRPGYFRLLCGRELIARYESSPGHVRCFCRRCGSTLGEPDLEAEDASFTIAAGLLDGDVGRSLYGHEYVDSKAPWYEIADDLRRFPEAFPPLPGRPGSGEPRS